jgi:hypothetical protein
LCVAAGGDRLVFGKRAGDFPSRGHIIAMADRYQDRAYSAGGNYDRDGRARASDNDESDPLAELARLIGQTDPFSKPMSRANLQAQPPARPADPEPSYDNYEDAEPYEAPPPAPPSWMQRAAVRREPPPPPPQDDYPDEDAYPSEVHPLHRYAAQHHQAEPDYEHEHTFAEVPQQQADPARYDEALYGSFGSDPQQAQHDHGYVDNAYAYDDDQNFEAVEEPRRRGGMVTVFAVLALAVFGVGGAYAYRTFTGSARGGEPPIIRADAGPTKIVPAPADAAAKVPDRMVPGDGTEKIVSREETPIDPNTRSGPRVVFPPLTPGGTAPLPPSVVPPSAPAQTTSAPNGTFSNNDPRKIKTFSVRGDQAEAGAPASAAPPAAPAKPAATTRGVPSARSASNPATASANSPLSLAPQSDASAAVEPPVRMAATNPAQAAPAPATPSAAASSGSYLVSITSQPSEAEAQASYRAMQSKYASVLGSQSPVIVRGNKKDGTATYRAGPAFATSAEAAQFCKSYQSAGGQCWVVKN